VKGVSGEDARTRASVGRRLTGRRRSRHPNGRSERVFVRLSPTEYEQLAAAATAAGLTPTSYVAETALAVAQDITNQQHEACGITRNELAQLQQSLFDARTAINQLASGGGTPTGASEQLQHCAQALAHLDTVISAIDSCLRQDGAAS
jgi:uncharacterized protein (DUF1778 family)